MKIVPGMYSFFTAMFRRGVERPGKIALAAGLLLLFQAMLLLPQVEASHEVTPEREAWYLVRRRCILCHYIDQPRAKFAPSLYGLFKRPNGQLYNGKPVTDQTVSEQIAQGSANMPAFKNTLNEREISLIVRYLKGGFPNATKQDGTFPNYDPPSQ